MQIRVAGFFLILGFMGLGTLQLAIAQSGQGLFEYITPSSLQQIIREEATSLGKERKLEKADLQTRLAGFVTSLTKRIQKEVERDPGLPKSSPAALSAKEKKNFESAIRARVAKLLRDKNSFAGWQFLPDYNDRILSFHSDISVAKDGLLKVKETITIYNGMGESSDYNDYNPSGSYTNNDIQRGIVRDFPTKYLNKNGFWENVGFKIKSVTQNGKPADYEEKNLDNGTRIMVGNADVYLPSGIFTYEIAYETSRQLIFHEDKDELYWNVNGNGWVFSIDSASCLIQFPEEANIFENACYTGFQGSTERNCFSRQMGQNRILFSTSERLGPYQGLTVAAAIPKGILLPPTENSLINFLKANFGISIMGAVFLLLSVFYTLVWFKKGKDPAKGVIYPQLDPPEGLSGADCGYILDQKYGSHLFAAALIDMAVKKWLTIDVKVKKFIVTNTTYHFRRPQKLVSTPNTKAMYGFEAADLYGQDAEKGEYNATLKAKFDALQTQLKNRFLIRRGKKNTWNGLFVLNNGYTIFGGILIFGASIAGFLFMVNFYTEKIMIIIIGLFVLLLILQIFFVSIMSAYNQRGREIADHIEGFKIYLETAEQKLFDYLTPPDKTLELFEKYLPYAIALRVENAWAEKFDDILQKAIAGGYQPGYYSGQRISSSDFNMSSITRSISSGLSSTISSASTPPSSSGGGSGGGGSSGGGGGGGGGGGW